jgi:lipoyl(octanoyl) transferase
MKPPVELHYLGLQDYQHTYDAMKEFTLHRDINTPDQIWILEHPPVFTLGLAGDLNHLLNHNSNIDLVQVDRGGQITYHGPGQIIVYLLLDLKRLGIYVKELVFRMEQAIINTLTYYQIGSERKTGAPGIYISSTSNLQHARAKIAALGLKVTRHCSYHGLALNVNMDLSPFLMINPCGYPDLETIDMKSMGVEKELTEVSKTLVKELQEQLSSLNFQ